MQRVVLLSGGRPANTAARSIQWTIPPVRTFVLIVRTAPGRPEILTSAVSHSFFVKNRLPGTGRPLFASYSSTGGTGTSTIPAGTCFR
jgi:hypothetical protein